MFNQSKKINALIAIMIILNMTLYYFIFVGSTAVSYAIDIVNTNEHNIDYVAYFVDEDGNKIKQIDADVDKEQYLYVDVTVKNEGFFNGYIEIENNNFNIKNNLLCDQVENITSNKVTLKQINAGNTVTIKLAISVMSKSLYTEHDLNGETNIYLKGNYTNSKDLENNKTSEINGEEKVSVNWKSSDNIKAEISGNLITNSLEKINGEEKRIIQVEFSSKLTENNYPIKNTKLDVMFNGNIEDVKLYEKSTSATNGEIEFNNQNYSYNKESKTLEITLSNEDTNNISWDKGVNDNFIITYILEKDENISNTSVKINNIINTYDGKQLTNENITYVDSEKYGIVDGQLVEKEEEIYKGKLYSGEERSYIEKSKIDINLADAVNSLQIIGDNSYFTNENRNISNSNIYYTKTIISKNQFISIFGENGYLNISYDNGENIKITKDTQVNNGSNFVITYPENVRKISITTSKPLKEGTLFIYNTKTIHGENYSRNDISKFSGILNSEKINVGREDNNAISIQKETNITLKETSSNAKIELEKEKLSVLNRTQDMKLRVKLDTSDESKNLYKDTTLQIILPNEITKAELKQVNVIYANGMKLGEYNLVQNSDGKFQININLNGEQLQYDKDNVTEIYVYLGIYTNILTPTQSDEINLVYKNGKDLTTNTTSEQIKFESVNGLMLYDTVLNYNDAKEQIETYSENAITGALDMASSRNQITLGTALVNNYDTEITNMILVGKLPNKGEGQNTYTATINDISIDTNATILYSADENVDINNGNWTENKEKATSYKIIIDKINPKQIVKVQINIGIPTNLEYNEYGEILVNANYTNQGVNYERKNTINLQTEKSMTAKILKLGGANSTLEDGLVVNISSTSSTNEINNGDSIYEGQTVKYKITILNSSDKEINNIKVTADETNGKVWDNVTLTTYNPATESNQEEVHYRLTENTNIELGEIDTLASNETATFEYEASADELEDENTATMYGIVNLEYDEKTQTAKTAENPIKDAELKVRIEDLKRQDAYVVDSTIYQVGMSVKNIGNKTLKDVSLKMVLSSEVYLNEEIAYCSFTLDDDENPKGTVESIEKNDNDETILNMNIPTIKEGEEIIVYVYPIAKEMTEESKIASIYATAKTSKGNEYLTNITERKIVGLTKNITVDGKAYIGNEEVTDTDIIKNGSTITLKYIINNKDTRDAELEISEVINSIYLSNNSYGSNVNTGLEVVSVNVTKNNETTDISQYVSDGVLRYTVDLQAKERCSFTIKLKLNTENMTGTVEKNDISLNFKVVDTDGLKEYSKDISLTSDRSESERTLSNGEVLDDKESNGEMITGNTDNQSSLNKHKVTGIAWIDSNKDGKKDSSENTIKNINVRAVNADAGTLIEENTTTDDNGKYELNLTEGNYIILFLYDDTEYNVTTYQAVDANENENSDAIRKEITINGNKTTVGMTDKIALNSDKSNIDIGLILREKSDLKVEKFIKKITVSTDKGTDTKEFDNSNMAKTEIASKYINGSLVTAEYVIKVTNAGEISTYIGDIVDEYPTDLEFKSDINGDWYLKDNKLYNNSMEGKILEPGESKEVTLVLTKTMTQSNLGIVSNTAYIENNYTESGIEDSDSSNNKSSANMIISVKTGLILSYVTITLIIIIVDFVIAYILAKKFMIK